MQLLLLLLYSILQNCEIVCIDPHQTAFVGKGNDHLQLIKFGPSGAHGKGSVVGKFLGSALLARSVCVSLDRFLIAFEAGHNNIVFIKLVT